MERVLGDRIRAGLQGRARRARGLVLRLEERLMLSMLRPLMTLGLESGKGKSF